MDCLCITLLCMAWRLRDANDMSTHLQNVRRSPSLEALKLPVRGLLGTGLQTFSLTFSELSMMLSKGPERLLRLGGFCGPLTGDARERPRSSVSQLYKHTTRFQASKTEAILSPNASKKTLYPRQTIDCESRKKASQSQAQGSPVE